MGYDWRERCSRHATFDIPSDSRFTTGRRAYITRRACMSTRGLRAKRTRPRRSCRALEPRVERNNSGWRRTYSFDLGIQMHVSSVTCDTGSMRDRSYREATVIERMRKKQKMHVPDHIAAILYTPYCAKSSRPASPPPPCPVTQSSHPTPLGGYMNQGGDASCTRCNSD